MARKPTELDELSLKKKMFLEAYKLTFGNITQACAKAGINSRQTYYDWLEKDAAFKSELESINPKELLVDHAESALVRRIDADDTTAIIFALKTQGKKRGYIEKQEVEHSGEIKHGVVYLPTKTNDPGLDTIGEAAVRAI